MRLDDDFDDNMKEITRYSILVCIVLIAIWFFTLIMKMILPEEDTSPKKMLKEETNIEHTLDKLVDENAEVDEVKFLNEGKILPKAGNKSFTLYVEDLPNNIYYSQIYTQDKVLAEKRARINQQVGDNYIDSVLSYGTLVRWNPDSFPLKVYIKLHDNAPEFHLQEIKNAFQRWQDATQGFISFVYVDKPDDANIVCSYPDDFVRACESCQTTMVSRQYFTYGDKGNILRSNIDLTYKDCNGEAYAQDMMYAVVLREIGHSLGLRGHSGIAQDNTLYYPEANRQHSVRPVINKSDINTLRLIYSIQPDKIDKALSDEQNQKLIKVDEVWGDNSARSISNEKAVLYNLEMTPDVPDLYVSLANYYKEREEYDKAISVYNRSIVLMNNADLKSKVYARVGDTYNLQDRYQEAVESYKLSLKTLNNKQSLFDVYFNLGVIYYKQKKYNDALMNFQSALKYVYDRENSYRVLVNLTQVYLKTGYYINALKCAEKAYSIKRTNVSTYLYAFAKYRNAETVDAQTILEENISPKSSAGMYGLLAQVYYDTQQYDALESLVTQVKTVFPNKIIFTFK